MAFGGVHPFMLKKAGAAGGASDLFSVTPCAGGSNVLCENTTSITVSVDDVVVYGDGSTDYCGTIYSTGQSGTAAYDLSSTGFSDCSECESSLGGPGGGP